MMHYMNFLGIGFNGFGFGWIFMILFWGLVVLGVIYFFKSPVSSSKAAFIGKTAEEILKRRYASGEISKDEYHDKMLGVHGKS